MDKNKTKSWIISNVLRWKISSASLAILTILAIIWSVLHWWSWFEIFLLRLHSQLISVVVHITHVRVHCVCLLRYMYSIYMYWFMFIQWNPGNSNMDKLNSPTNWSYSCKSHFPWIWPHFSVFLTWLTQTQITQIPC